MGRQLIALVDGDKAFLEILNEWLQEDGYETVCCLERSEALDVIIVRQPGLVILDVGRYGKELTVLKQLRQELVTARLPIIAVSAWSPEMRAERARVEALAQIFLEKPISLNVLMHHVHALIGPPLAES
jgi:DNA-binding response OmpR family regulator